MISKPLSSFAGYSPVIPGCEHPPKPPFHSGLAWSLGGGSAYASTALAAHLHLGCLPHKAWSLSLEIHNPSREMERAWEEGMSSLSGAQWHQESPNVPAPTRDGFYDFCRGADAQHAYIRHSSVLTAMPRLGGAILYVSVWEGFPSDFGSRSVQR